MIDRLINSKQLKGKGVHFLQWIVVLNGFRFKIGVPLLSLETRHHPSASLSLGSLLAVLGESGLLAIPSVFSAFPTPKMTNNQIPLTTSIAEHRLQKLLITRARRLFLNVLLPRHLQFAVPSPTDATLGSEIKCVSSSFTSRLRESSTRKVWNSRIINKITCHALLLKQMIVYQTLRWCYND